MGLSPRRVDIDSRQFPDASIKTRTFTEPDFDGMRTSIETVEGQHLASYVMETGPTKLPNEFWGLMEGLVAARFATEALVNVVNTTENPTPVGYDELLTKFGMAAVALDGAHSARMKSPRTHTILLSGGVDGAHILFQRLHGQASAVTFNHGQGTWSSGIWGEKDASVEVVKLARETFGTSVPHQTLAARWKCNVPRTWAKAYRNFMLVLQGFAAAPGTVVVGTSVDDRVHDSFPEFISAFSEITGVEIYVPNIQTGRREIMGDMVRLSTSVCPYLLASTMSCQRTRFLGKRELFCGNCHSCLLRLPGAEFGSDPRFSTRNGMHVIPKALESIRTPNDLIKAKPSTNILHDFLSAFASTSEAELGGFCPVLRLMRDEWDMPPEDFLTVPQLTVFYEKEDALKKQS